MSASTAKRADATHRRVRMIPAFVGIITAVVLSVLGVGIVANAADQVTVSITNTFSPSNVTINIGTTVTWTNNDSRQHELRSDSGPVEFRTDNLDPGQSASVTFNTLGTYSYNDHRNQNSTAYHGTIVVTDGVIPTTPAPGAITPPTAPPAPTTASVHLAGAQFAPATITVGVGGTVTWLNDDGSKHTVTAADASFDSGSLNAGATFVHTFPTAGTFPYGCDFHGNMRGTIIVTAGGTTPPPAAAPPVTPAPPVSPPAATPAPAAGTTNASVTIANNLFSPATISVSAGSTVTWVNSDAVTHTVTADNQSFTSGLMKNATSWSQTFATPGTFSYFCEIHPAMTGTVVATAPDGSAPVAAPASAVAPTATPGPASGATGSAGATTGSINIADSGFTPASFRVAVGGTLTFANSGKAAHTVTADAGSFDSGMIKSGATWAHTFSTAGSFAYSCILHPKMRATIDVVPGASGAGSAASAAGANEAAGATGQLDATPTTTAAIPADATIQPVNVDVADNVFNPNAATVAVGGTVTWKLSGAVPHTVTATDQSFNSGLLHPGETYQYTFTTLGSFTYACLVHPGMTGTINVVPPEQAAAAATTTGSAQQAPPAATQAEVASATAPAKDAGLLGNTLLGIAAVLAACCALVFALKSFLKVLSAKDTSEPTPVGELTPQAI